MCRKSRNQYFFLAGEFKAQNANKWDAAWSVSLWREGENWREWRMRIERERMSSSNFLFDRERRLERERRRQKYHILPVLIIHHCCHLCRCPLPQRHHHQQSSSRRLTITSNILGTITIDAKRNSNQKHTGF